MENSANQKHFELREQISRAAASAFNMQRATDILRSCDQLFAQRNYLAYLIDKGLLKDTELAIREFNTFNEVIRKHLSL